MFGLFVSPFLAIPGGWEEGPRGLAVPSREFAWLVYGAVIQACVLSMVLEYVVLYPFRKKMGIRHLEWCVVLGNLVSYAVLGLAFLKASKLI